MRRIRHIKKRKEASPVVEVVVLSLEEMSYAELKDLAKQTGVRYVGVSKANLVAALGG